MNQPRIQVARWFGIVAATVMGAIATSIIMQPHPAQLAIANSVRPTAPAPIPNVVGVPTTALTVDHTNKGAMVVDGRGFRLYFYNRDQDHPSASVCVSQCAVDWPPVLAGDTPPRLSGISRAQIGSLLRPDGLRQLTLDGWPLYRYRADTTPGVGTGNGINATWYLIGPTGQPTIPPAKVTLPPNDHAMGNLEGEDDNGS